MLILIQVRKPIIKDALKPLLAILVGDLADLPTVVFGKDLFTPAAGIAAIGELPPIFFADLPIAAPDVATLIAGKGLSIPDLTAGNLLFVVVGKLVFAAILVADFLSMGTPVSGSFSTISIGCKAKLAKGSGRPLETVFAQLSPLVGGIKPTATSTETGLPGTVGLVAATTGLTGAVAVGAVGVVGGTAAVGAGGVGAVAAGVAAGAAGLPVSPPQPVNKIAIPIAPT